MSAAPRVFPAIDRWTQDRPDLPEAVAVAARWFDAHLPDGWEVFVQPPLNGLRPDLVVVHPEHGAAVYAIDCTPTDLPPEAHAEHMMLLHQRIGLSLDELAGAGRLPKGRRSAGLHSLRLRADRFDDPARLTLGYVLGPLLRASADLPPQAASLWRRWLRDDRALPPGERTLGFGLSAQQREIVANPTGVRARRIRGAAGSGKSIVLAGRAAKLAAEGKRVLVLSYNATLPAYLMDLAAKQSADPKGLFLVTALHFHAWLRRMASLAGALDAFNEVMDDGGLKHPARLADEARHWIATLATFQKWDAVIVDEAQDLHPAFWPLIRAALRSPNGEVLVAADRTQNIYGVAAPSELQMEGFGFRGPWTTLESTFRLPPRLCALARDFLEAHMPLPDSLPPESPQGTLAFGVELGWQSVVARDLVPTAVAAVKRHVARWEREERPTQTVCLVPTKGLGRAIVAGLEDAGIEVKHTFGVGDTPDERRAEAMRRKRQLRPGEPGVLVTTVHSFKGWEGRSIIGAVGHDQSQRARMLLYTAMTRLRNDPQGAMLSLISADPSLADEAARWAA
jgi:hypothetical protein